MNNEPPSRRRRARRLFGLLVVDISPLRAATGFRWLFAGQFGAVLARQILVVAVPYQVFVLTRSSWLVGLVGLVQIAPLIGCSILGGTAADALDRRRLLLMVQVLMALTSVGFALKTIAGGRVWLIMVLIAVNAGVSGVESPSRTAVIPAVVPRDQLASAFALNQTLNQTGQIVGPAVAGLLVANLGISAAYWLSAAACVFTGIALLPLGPQKPEGASGRVSFSATIEGWRYLRSVPVLQQIMLIDLNAMVFGMPRALFPVIGTVMLGGDATTVGLLHSAPGVGALLGAATTGWASAVRRHGRVIVVAVSIWGLAIMGFGLAPNLPIALLCLGVAGAADVVSNVFRTTFIQLLLPDNLRGRLTAFKVALSGGGPRLGDAEAGAVAAVTTPTISVVSGGAMSIIGTLLIAWRGRALWDLTTGPDEEEEGAATASPGGPT